MNINFEKSGGLVPVIIQDEVNQQVLMLGYMNKEAYEKTVKEEIVTFYSRSKQRLWTKGESSGNFLKVKKIDIDCDEDTLLIQVNPVGPVCHRGTDTCFGDFYPKGYLYELEQVISQRIEGKQKGSYTYSLYERGVAKVAQKVGEEAVEVVIEAMQNDTQLLKEEAADLLYHFLILLQTQSLRIEDIENLLRDRAKKN